MKWWIREWSKSRDTKKLRESSIIPGLRILWISDMLEYFKCVAIRISKIVTEIHSLFINRRENVINLSLLVWKTDKNQWPGSMRSAYCMKLEFSTVWVSVANIWKVVQLWRICWICRISQVEGTTDVTLTNFQKFNSNCILFLIIVNSFLIKSFETLYTKSTVRKDM